MAARRFARLAAAALVVAALAAACGRDPAGLRAPDGPRLDSAAVASNPHNVLSAVVHVRARRADSVAVRFRPADEPAADSATPAVLVAGDSAVVPVLGLLAGRAYVARVVAYGRDGGVATSDSLPFTTGALPADLPRYAAGGPSPSPGYVVFAAGRYGLAIDNTGRVVWYRSWAAGAGLNFVAQPNGHFTVRPTTPEPADVEPWLEVDPLGAVTRTLGCAGGLPARPHDLLVGPAGDYWILCDEVRVMDLSADGGRPDARVTGTVVQHVAVSGALLFQWSAFDHFAITDLDPAERAGAVVNWTHGNALDLDADGTLIVSFRNLNEVTKIDPASGAVIWRLGGRRNEFELRSSADPAFVHQHGARVVAPGELLLLDNIGNPAESRGERYVLDEARRTATLTQSLGSTPRAVTLIGGSVQRLPGGRTLVSFGTAGRVAEYDAAGQIVWQIAGDAGYVFRAQRVRSLYAPGVGTAR